jgi:outer membrane protein assembly factor BamB
VNLPGPGASSPITLGDRVFVTSYRGYGVDKSIPGELAQLERVLVCLNRADGKVLWEAAVKGTADEDRYQGFIQSHGYATSTPATDGKRVYVFFGKAGVLAFDLNGKQLWQTSVGTGSAQMGWGQGTSLILYQNSVIVPAFAEGKALVALDQETGKPLW